MIAFFDDHFQVYRAELICKVLPIGPATYNAHVAKRANPSKLSARAKQDNVIQPEIVRVFKANFEICGVKKNWHQMVHERFDFARCTVAQLMRGMRLAGVIRGQSIKTTVQDMAVPCRAVHAESCKQELQGTGTERALGLRLHMRKHPDGLRLRGLRHRRLCTPHRRLACEPNTACWLRAGRT